ncbi:hypothetical protein EDEG_05075 [Edhazardia aedis USNM 41457]|uniref:Fork-head domain-containing protein n=1 Tax=Edhazardia aedis (strain USNM 41457) TaxID=1003232 RepID=A0A0L1P6I4_EDHAE|nr:hypothetical protein EDEG_05075 [Edhazardia aedis USNM 41457]|eukprot:KNH48541.1 hypothetical protein EDEG_05075 [Edhazardia aedis USNM 41457]
MKCNDLDLSFSFNSQRKLSVIATISKLNSLSAQGDVSSCVEKKKLGINIDKNNKINKLAFYDKSDDFNKIKEFPENINHSKFVKLNAECDNSASISSFCNFCGVKDCVCGKKHNKEVANSKCQGTTESFVNCKINDSKSEGEVKVESENRENIFDIENNDINSIYKTESKCEINIIDSDLSFKNSDNDDRMKKDTRQIMQFGNFENTNLQNEFINTENMFYYNQKPKENVISFLDLGLANDQKTYQNVSCDIMQNKFIHNIAKNNNSPEIENTVNFIDNQSDIKNFTCDEMENSKDFNSVQQNYIFDFIRHSKNNKIESDQLDSKYGNLRCDNMANTNNFSTFENSSANEEVNSLDKNTSNSHYYKQEKYENSDTTILIFFEKQVHDNSNNPNTFGNSNYIIQPVNSYKQEYSKDEFGIQNSGNNIKHSAPNDIDLMLFDEIFHPNNKNFDFSDMKISSIQNDFCKKKLFGTNSKINSEEQSFVQNLEYTKPFNLQFSNKDFFAQSKNTEPEFKFQLKDSHLEKNSLSINSTEISSEKNSYDHNVDHNVAKSNKNFSPAYREKCILSENGIYLSDKCLNNIPNGSIEQEKQTDLDHNINFYNANFNLDADKTNFQYQGNHISKSFENQTSSHNMNFGARNCVKNIQENFLNIKNNSNTFSNQYRNNIGEFKDYKLNTNHVNFCNTTHNLYNTKSGSQFNINNNDNLSNHVNYSSNIYNTRNNYNDLSENKFYLKNYRNNHLNTKNYNFKSINPSSTQNFHIKNILTDNDNHFNENSHLKSMKMSNAEKINLSYESDNSKNESNLYPFRKGVETQQIIDKNGIVTKGLIIPISNRIIAINDTKTNMFYDPQTSQVVNIDKENTKESYNQFNQTNNITPKYNSDTFFAPNKNFIDNISSTLKENLYENKIGEKCNTFSAIHNDNLHIFKDKTNLNSCTNSRYYTDLEKSYYTTDHSTYQNSPKNQTPQYRIKQPNIKLHKKPKYSYAILIKEALARSEKDMLSLKEIVSWIQQTFPFFQTHTKTLYSSVRHNLSIHHVFISVKKSRNESGKGGYWVLDWHEVIRNQRWQKNINELGILDDSFVICKVNRFNGLVSRLNN